MSVCNTMLTEVLVSYHLKHMIEIASFRLLSSNNENRANLRLTLVLPNKSHHDVLAKRVFNSSEYLSPLNYETFLVGLGTKELFGAN